MYGGLFGDLPAAKNETDGDSAAERSNKSDKQETTVQTEEDDGQQKKQIRVVEEPKAIKSSSVLQSLGAAGTSMAFVPSHLKRKRNNTNVNATKKPAPVFVKSTAAATPQPNTTSSSVGSSSSVINVAAATDLASWKEETQPIQQEKHFHDPHAANPTESSTPGSFSSTTAVEPEALRRLHDSVTDPYDPLVPNDLLQYWERQAAIQERRELEREAKEAMEAQVRMREQLEVERKELEASGDVDKIVEHQHRTQMAAGRGRGRGISNLPKWLVDKQRKEAELRNVPKDKNEIKIEQ